MFYFAIAETRYRPKAAAAIQSDTFNKILMAAFNKSPCCINNKESNENVEKVVNAPKNPIPIKVLWILISKISCSINWYNKPIINEPVILTIKVAKGNPFLANLTLIVKYKNVN